MRTSSGATADLAAAAEAAGSRASITYMVTSVLASVTARWPESESVALPQSTILASMPTGISTTEATPATLTTGTHHLRKQGAHRSSHHRPLGPTLGRCSAWRTCPSSSWAAAQPFLLRSGRILRLIASSGDGRTSDGAGRPTLTRSSSHQMEMPTRSVGGSANTFGAAPSRTQRRTVDGSTPKAQTTSPDLGDPSPAGDSIRSPKPPRASGDAPGLTAQITWGPARSSAGRQRSEPADR